jgi:hypothetical protein
VRSRERELSKRSPALKGERIRGATTIPPPGRDQVPNPNPAAVGFDRRRNPYHKGVNMLPLLKLICYGMIATLILTAGLAAQSASSGSQNAPAEASLCDSLDPNMPHADALSKVCQYAVTVPERMPNFTCQQETSRHLSGALREADTITGVVTYEDGKESYHDLKQNGRPVDNTASLPGAWSAGQFGNHLQSIFDGRNKVAFQFVGENKIEGREAWEFTYRIAHQDVPLWRLEVPGQMVAPPYNGKLWIDQQSGVILRLQVEANELPRSFPIRNAKLEIDYEDVPLGDATRFVLPVKSVLNSIEADGVGARNIQRFQNCQKFRATSRIVPQEEAP